MLIVFIIHAVGDVITTPTQAIRFWKISPLEFLIFISSIIVTIFTTIEIGIYTSVGASLVVLLYRVAKPGGEFLGLIRIQTIGDESHEPPSTVYVPLNRNNLNPLVHVEAPPPGMLIFRFVEALTYPNASRINDRIVDFAKEHTRPGMIIQYKKLGDRPWNEGYVPRSMDKVWYMNKNDTRPLLRSIVYDFAGVSNIDCTGVQALVDIRQQLDRYADFEVEYHFAHIQSPWIKRALVAGGFGSGNPKMRILEVVTVPSVITPDGSNFIVNQSDHQEKSPEGIVTNENLVRTLSGWPFETKDAGDLCLLPIIETNCPFFHLSLDHAVRSAESATKAP